MAACLIITGFMGSGKTTVARELSGRLAWRFRDADSEAERQMGMTIGEAFAQMGESGFRQVEEAVVLRLLDEAATSDEDTVIALGGGAVTSRRLRQLLAAESLVVFIDADIDTAFARAADGTRPLAVDRQQFARLYRDRLDYYREVAGRIIDARGKDVAGVSDEIMDFIEEKDRH